MARSLLLSHPAWDDRFDSLRSYIIAYGSPPGCWSLGRGGMAMPEQHSITMAMSAPPSECALRVPALRVPPESMRFILPHPFIAIPPIPKYDRIPRGTVSALAPGMGRPIRLFEPGRLQFITQRTIHGRLLLRPNHGINNILGAALARACQKFKVKIYAFVFLSNHFHLIASKEDGNLADFMQWLNSVIAKRVGRQVGWRDKFWARRYSAEPILDDEAALERLRYVLAHGVKEGLVERASEWPGLTCIPELLHDVRRVFRWLNGTARHESQLRGERRQDSDFESNEVISISLLPCWAGLSKKEVRDELLEHLADVEREAAGMRSHKPALGVEGVLQQDPHSEPTTLKRSPRPLCHGSTRSIRNAFKETYRAFVDAYRQACAQLQAGESGSGVEFPPYCFRPGAPWVWVPG